MYIFPAFKCDIQYVWIQYTWINFQEFTRYRTSKKKKKLPLSYYKVVQVMFQEPQTKKETFDVNKAFWMKVTLCNTFVLTVKDLATFVVVPRSVVVLMRIIRQPFAPVRLLRASRAMGPVRTLMVFRDSEHDQHRKQHHQQSDHLHGDLSIEKHFCQFSCCRLK